MRLWHKDLIHILPRRQLLGQWRECCAIASKIARKGTPNNVIANRVTEYPMCHLYTYGTYVFDEMTRRGYRADFERFGHYFTYPHERIVVPKDDLFSYWHNKRYLKQCYYNLEEKYDCGAITKKDFEMILLNVDV